MIEYIIHVPLLAALGYLVLNPLAKRYGKWPLASLLVKILSGVAVGLVFTHFYSGGDTWALHEQITSFNKNHTLSLASYSYEIFQPIDPYSGNPRTVFLIRLLSPLSWTVRDNYWLLAIYLAIFSFWATWKLIRSLDNYYPNQQKQVIAVFCFFPSLIFWTSGIMKDTLAIGCLFVLTSHLVNFYHRGENSWIGLLEILLGFFLLFKLRHYLAGAFGFVALFVFSDQWLKQKGSFYRIVSLLVVIGITAILIRYFYIRLRPERFPLTFYELHESIQSRSDPESLVHFELKPTWSSIVVNSPKALLAGLFRPLPGEIRNPLGLLQGIENLFILLLFAASLYRFKKIKLPDDSLILGSILFILLLATVLPLTSPNLGTLSRYRTSYMPFFVLLTLYYPFQGFLNWSNQRH